MYIKLIKFLATILLCSFSHFALAMPEFTGWWLNEYSRTPESSESVCQLCHQRPDGGNGWNQYGWDIRSAYGGGGEFAFRGALSDVEDSLTIGGVLSYLQEIQAGTQPGWGEGAVNVINFNDDAPSITIAPPEELCGIVDPGSEPLPCAILDPDPSSIAQGTIEIGLETVASGFTAPVLAVSAPGEFDYIYVVEQAGLVWRVDLATGNKGLFLDFTDEVIININGFDERGLLGLTFHPNYANNNLIYTYISKAYVEGAEHFTTMPDGVDPNHQTVVSEWLVVNPQSSPAVKSNELELLIVDQPQFNHNGGMVEFGPDGYLYISIGDGGCANDEAELGGPCSPSGGHGDNGNGRDNTNPLGAILRIDVNSELPVNGRYTIPSSNPFVGTDGLDEIYAYGFRNPFRFSFEELANNEFNLYVGDVGQNAIEEVDRIHSDSIERNFGWNYKEGSFFFYNNANGVFVSDLPPPNQVIPPLVDPIAEYDHDEGISVIGGHVYSGTKSETLKGKYVFADWGTFSSPSGRLFYLDESDQMFEFNYLNPTNMYITGFGKDNQNELYIVGSQTFLTNGTSGVLRRLVLSEENEEICMPIKAPNGNIAVICL